jgi:hypothetical protein
MLHMPPQLEAKVNSSDHPKTTYDAVFSHSREWGARLKKAMYLPPRKERVSELRIQNLSSWHSAAYSGLDGR